MTSIRLAGALLLLAPAVMSAQAGIDADSVNAVFTARVKSSTARYRDRDVAVRDGYRRIGPDFPGMGEHWISVPLLLDGTVDAEHPPILEYVIRHGVPTLVGVAYAVLLPPHEAPPSIDGLLVGAADWHYHGGTVGEESFIAGHLHGAAVNHGKPRVAVLHVWAWLDNPAGPFATDNWTLPFYRLDLPWPPIAPPVEVMHGMALAAGGAPYYLRALAIRNEMPVAAPGIGARLDRAATEIRAMLGELPLELALGRIGDLWRKLQRDIEGLP